MPDEETTDPKPEREPEHKSEWPKREPMQARKPEPKPERPTALKGWMKDWPRRNAAAAAKAASETERRRLKELEWQKALKADRKEREKLEKEWIRAGEHRGR
ncbi:MAG: hypothetical protein KAY37_04435 [Phycisphaerae bacterium]|nr:hypothetical protein [Phycisphaerae bacterium]